MAIFGKTKQQHKDNRDQQSEVFCTTAAQDLHHQDAQSYKNYSGITTQMHYVASTDSPQYMPYQQIIISNYLLPVSTQVPGRRLAGETSKLALPACLDLSESWDPNSTSCFPERQLCKTETPKSRQEEAKPYSERAELQADVMSKLELILVSMGDGPLDDNVRELFGSTRKGFCPKNIQAPRCNSAEAGPKVSGGMQSNTKGNSKTPAASSSVLFSKVKCYGNSQLSECLPPVSLHLQTFPLLCLAAQYSERVYDKPTKTEKETHVAGDWRIGTKAMVIKSLPMDSMNVIIFAIRGSQTFLDWAVNLNSNPASPRGFLDDEGNLCHTGFLSLAKKMLQPVTARLKDLLQNDPTLSNCSLLITGHSAGGAVAALLYSHMLATSREARSELNTMTTCFKRVHCITFGAPPVSLLPLRKPDSPHLRKSLFISFVNEGDPVARAEKAYMRTLLDLYTSPVPAAISHHTHSSIPPSQNFECAAVTKETAASKMCGNKSNSAPTILPNWPIPPSTFSNAGKIILLRQVFSPDVSGKKKKKNAKKETTRAFNIDDSLLRSVIWGDPVCHAIRLYVKRIEALATFAVVGRDREEG